MLSTVYHIVLICLFTGISGAVIAIIIILSILVVLLIIIVIIYYYCYKKNRTLDGLSPAGRLARAVAHRSGFFVQLASGQADETEASVESEEEHNHEIDDFSHVAPSDGVSLPSAEYTDTI